MVGRNELTEGHARAVLAVPDNDGRRKLARRIVREGLSVRAAERAARWAGARTKERKATSVDPVVAGRIKEAVKALTGFEAKVGAAGVHVPLDGEVQLEELAEALERLLADPVTERAGCPLHQHGRAVAAGHRVARGDLAGRRHAESLPAHGAAVPGRAPRARSCVS